jgi:glycosyltransferase involved in cell wall biosynthesis
MTGSMRILFLAPQPFYQERGTPIAVDLALCVLRDLGHEIRVLTFPGGRDRNLPGVTIERVRPLLAVGAVPPGFSFGKLLCGAAMAGEAKRVTRTWRPHLVHAVEESVFIARTLRSRFGVPYVYDMDSSMAMQLIEKMPWLAPAGPLFRNLEAKAARDALAVVPVCPALAQIAEGYGASRIRLLTDISLLDPGDTAPALDLREAAGIHGFAFLYIGNLEGYQGIELMLSAFAIALKREPGLALFIVGGPERAAARFRAQAERMGISGRVRFTGPRPLDQMGALFRGADALVSPRVRGLNTPMKIYSYLDSGKPVLATDLPTHTQVLTDRVAELAAPEPEAFAGGMLHLARDPLHAARLAAAAHEQVRARHSRAAYRDTLAGLYSELQATL